MKVCPYCYQRYPWTWIEICVDDDVELVPWNMTFDRVNGLRRAEMKTIDADVNQLVWLNSPMKNRDDLPIVVDRWIWPENTSPLSVLLPKGFDEKLVFATEHGRGVQWRQAMLTAISRNVTGCIELIDNYFPNLHAGRTRDLVAKIFDKKASPLYAGGVGANAPHVTTARVKFLTAFVASLQSATFPVGRSCNNKQIKMELLLGKKVQKLFRPAIDEEVKSARYREAVIIGGTREYAESAAELDWTKAKHVVVGGSSGAGKTYSAKLILRAIYMIARHFQYETAFRAALHVRPPKGVKLSPKAVMQYIVSVDGGDARARSQIRSICLQVALALGYNGISDLQKNTGGMDFKKCIKDASRRARVHVVEPRTFTNPKKEGYSKIIQDPLRAILAIIHADKKVIAKQGENRAWYNFKKHANKPLLPIDPNKEEIGCESKKYSAGKFGISRELGAFASKQKLAKYISRLSKAGKKPLSVEVVSGGKIEGSKVNYHAPTIVWVYFGNVKTKSMLKGYAIINPLKTAAPDKILKAASSMKTIAIKETHKNMASQDRWWKIAEFDNGARYCVIIPGMPKK